MIRAKAKKFAMKCKFCNQELLNEDVYCNYCGKKIKDVCIPDKKNENVGDIKISSQLISILFFIMAAGHCIDGILDTDFFKSINPFIKSENSIIDRYDETEVRKEVENYINEQKETLPLVISDGATLINIELVGTNLVSTVEMEGALPSDYNQQIIDDIKEQILSSGVLDGKYGQFFREFGYGIIYSYVNEYNEALYKIHIYPHEL